MKRFNCDCGQPLFFDSSICVSCGTAVGFDPGMMTMRTLPPPGERTDLHRCANGTQFDACNWLHNATTDAALCFGCQFNRTIPNLDHPLNLERWRKLEAAKKRLLFTLLSLRLPLTPGELAFDFVEDSRSNPDLVDQSIRYTGYDPGLITVNVLEADDVVRESEREAVNEQYRTLLGHLRHESGHHYLELLLAEPADQAAFAERFGDPTQNYRGALDRYYAEGPAPDWRARCISSYASSHPVEDWAETWGHYLHIQDVLETAATHAVIPTYVATAELGVRITAWRELSITLNELNRSIGHGDAYPFVVTTAVESKLAFVDGFVSRLQTRP